MIDQEIAPFVAPKAEPRDYQAKTTLTASEYRELLEFSGGAPIDGEWVRHALLTLARRPRYDVKDVAEAVLAQTVVMQEVALTVLSALAPQQKVADLVRDIESTKWEKARRELAKTGDGR